MSYARFANPSREAREQLAILAGLGISSFGNLPAENGASLMYGMDEVIEWRMPRTYEADFTRSKKLERTDGWHHWELVVVVPDDHDGFSPLEARVKQLRAVGQRTVVHGVWREDVHEHVVVLEAVVTQQAEQLDLDGPARILVDHEVAAASRDCGVWHLSFEVHAVDSDTRFGEGERDGLTLAVRADAWLEHSSRALPDGYW